MRMLRIPNQSSVAKAFMEFDEAGRIDVPQQTSLPVRPNAIAIEVY